MTDETLNISIKKIPSSDIFIFGNIEEGRYIASIGNQIVGGKFITGAYGGIADFIKIYMCITGSDARVKCALYNANGILVGITEEKTIAATTFPILQRFNFKGTKPPILSRAYYYIVGWAQNTEGYELIYLTRDGANYRSESTYNSYPSSVVFNQYDGTPSIFCSYHRV